MVCKSSFGYSISFHPTLEEFEKYKQLFIDNVSKKFVNDRFVLSFEKGKKDFITHIQGFVEFQREKRSDTFRKSFNNTIIKEMEFANPKVALVIRPYRQNDLIIGVGYCLKEQSPELEGVVVYSYEMDYMLECRTIYLQNRLDKKSQINKVRLNLRTLPEIFKSYCLRNDIKDIKPVIILARMGLEDYYVLPLLLRKDLSKIVEYLILYMEGNPEKLADTIEGWI